ncbi:chemotaxis-specific protein-glutamate methyltransferase CheB [bacterium]|nr:chemotaxis-specific protein-glutamate methyltransferase CheB [bacterium]
MTDKSEKIRILIVDDSTMICSFWKMQLSKENDFFVAGVTHNGNQALEFLKDTPVDIILLDIEMPEMDGLTLLPLITKQYPKTKVLMVSAYTEQGSSQTIKALLMGASDYVTKPSTTDLGTEPELIVATLTTKIRAISETKEHIPTTTISHKSQASIKPSAIVIAASTGGPNALISFLKALRPQFEKPIFIVQHMPSMMIDSLAERITKSTSRPCIQPIDKNPIFDGNVYLAPGDSHMMLEYNQITTHIRLYDGPEENYCKPSADPLFRSAANVYRDKLLGVVLTGMGEDGKRGSIEIVKKHGIVIAQDEASSTVWGMPGAVVKENLASAIGTPECLASLIK